MGEETAGGVVRVVLIEEHPVVRYGTRAVLEATESIKVVGETGKPADAVALVRDQDAHVAIVGIMWAEEPRGIDLCREIKEALSRTRVLIFTAFPRPELLRRAISAGTDGFILKTMSTEDLVNAVRVVARGGSQLDQELTWLMLAQLRQPERQTDVLAGLSPRERDIFNLMSAGMSFDEIAGQLGIRPKTVRNLTSVIYRKVGVKNREELRMLGMRTVQARYPGG